MKTIRGILKRNDGEVILMADPDEVGRRERVYAANFSARHRTPVTPGLYWVSYSPRSDKISLDSEEKRQRTYRFKVRLEENAALEEIEAAGCSYVEQ